MKCGATHPIQVDAAAVVPALLAVGFPWRLGHLDVVQSQHSHHLVCVTRNVLLAQYSHTSVKRLSYKNISLILVLKWTHTHTSTHTSMHTSMYTPSCTQKHVRTHIHIKVFTHPLTHAHTHTQQNKITSQRTGMKAHQSSSCTSKMFLAQSQTHTTHTKIICTKNWHKSTSGPY